MKRWIMHVDMDAFFASVEQFDHPEYRGKALIVGGQSDRGVVSTCSYEARKYGVRSAMSMVEARKRCPHAIFVTGRMSRYAEVSASIMDIFKEFSPCIEPLSIDEAFLDLTGMDNLVGDITKLGREVKDKIKMKTGLTASVGIAPNKFLAKLASDLEKPDGLVIIREEEAEKIIAPLSVRRIFGIGEKAEKGLLQLGITTIGQLAACDPRFLKKVLGNNADTIHLLAQGKDERPVECFHEIKSIGKETTFAADLTKPAERRSELLDLCEQVGWRVRNRGVAGHTVTLKVKYASFKAITRSATMEVPVSLDEEIFAIINRLAEQVAWTEPVRLLGVSLSKLVPEGGEPLVAMADDAVMRKRNAVLDSLKNRFGEKIIKRGNIEKETR
ncbi:MAG: DNA polymerase IV [Candidatus Riflebacteria bacterium]|nr:DNA polymerase IV [Candidatus Riflebacteria bacterium]